jgi:hypothetical protein
VRKDFTVSFFGSLFGGSSPELNTLIGQYGQIGGQATGKGMSDINKASDFWGSILSGDSSKVSQALSPEIGAAKKSAQEQTKANSIFGTRSGGTAASNATTNDKVHSDITSLIGSLTNSSASNLASIGSSLLGTGLGALGQEQGAVEQRIQNWSQSILGKGITGAVQAGESFATGGLSGLASGGLPGQSAGQAFMSGGASGLSGGSPFFGG